MMGFASAHPILQFLLDRLRRVLKAGARSPTSQSIRWTSGAAGTCAGARLKSNLNFWTSI